MAWVTPTGHNDPSSVWYEEAKAYDDNLGDQASTISETGYLELTHAALDCDRVRVHCYDWIGAQINPEVSIDVYYTDAWFNIFSGVITKSTWVEKVIGSVQSVTKLRIKFTNSAASTHFLSEVDFGEYEAPVATYRSYGYIMG